MAAITSTAQQPQEGEQGQGFWLRNRRWDLIFITASVIVVPIPYLIYLLGIPFLTNIFGLDPESADGVSRNAVNIFVAVAIGGPHMMSTFLRTGLDNKFRKQYPMLIRSSLIIPVVVISLAFLNLELLLTVFFFWASLHVLHQVTYIMELYNHKEAKFARPTSSAVSLPARFVDYAVVLTCLFPIAAYKIWQGEFVVGANDLGTAIPDFFENEWLFILLSAIFFGALAVYIFKTFNEYRSGIINWPKTAFISITVFVAFWAPLLPNLDTAFQGLNTWHSFQYLAITFYIIKVRQQYGNLNEEAPFVARFSLRAKDSRGLYMLSTVMLLGSGIIFVLVYVLGGIVRPDLTADAHFDTAYYTAILSFLWIHYYHDHFLFTDFESLDDAYQHSAAVGD